MKKTIISLLTLFALFTVCMPYTTAITYAAETQASFTSQTLKLNNSESINYWLFTPKNAVENMPLIVYLHGGSGKGDDINTLTGNGFCQWVSEGIFDDVPAYIIFPQVASKYSGWGGVKQYVKQLIDFTVSKYKIDKNKISLTGHSMGGTGTYTIGAAYPDLFSCIAPMSGSIDYTNEKNISAFLNMPVWAFVGDKDTIVPPESSINFVSALNNSGGSAKLTVFEGATHFDIPTLAYLDKSLDVLGWLIGNTKESGITSFANGIVNVNITVPGEYTVIFADYDEQGRLLNFKLSEQTFVYGKNTLKAPNDIVLGKGDKIMVWEYSRLRPICDAYTVK